jgi:hypothetical protein
MKLKKFKIRPDTRFWDGDYGNGECTGEGNDYGRGYGDPNDDELKTEIKHHVVDMYQLSFGEVINDSI